MHHKCLDLSCTAVGKFILHRLHPTSGNIIQLSIFPPKVQHKPATMSDAAPGRPMKFPYTISAKIAQFPFKYYVSNQWIWKYWMVGIGVSLPIIYKIHKLANSPENVSKWAEMRRKEAASHH